MFLSIDLQLITNEPISFYGFSSVAADLSKLVNECKKGLENGFTPRLAEQGTGATYFLHNHIG